MSLRELINKNRAAVAWAISEIVALCLAFVVLQLKEGGRPPLPKLPDQAFFTTDDGVTLFADSLIKIPPIDHGGQMAVLAHVFTCDGGRHQWVQCREKYRNSDQKILESSIAPAPLVNRPGDRNWISEGDPRVMAIVVPKCPDGSSSEPQSVIP